jgi:hypothetical protein
MDFYNKIYNFQSEYICRTCQKYFLKEKIPKLATSNGNKFHDLTSSIKTLSPLEERLVSPYLPFMQIRKLQPFALNPQLVQKGSVVNIAVEIDDMINILPRRFDQMSIVQIKLKRHIDHSTSYMHETIRPAAVCEALKYLKDTPLYLANNVQFDENWLNGFDNCDEVNFIADASDQKIDETTNIPADFFDFSDI